MSDKNSSLQIEQKLDNLLQKEFDIGSFDDSLLNNNEIDIFNQSSIRNASAMSNFKVGKSGEEFIMKELEKIMKTLKLIVKT